MLQNKKQIINVQGAAINILSKDAEDYISLTDMVKNFDGGGSLIEQWLKNKDTVIFLGVWEQMNNPHFKPLEFEGIKKEAGRNSFFLSAKKWIEATHARGLVASAGRYGGTYAHKDIAFEFGSWLSPEFKLYLIKEFQRLKGEENRRLSLDWNLNRTLAKLNYRLHTEAIKEHIIPKILSSEQINFVYASEADVLNIALFGQTAKQWRDANPQQEGNMREYASIKELLVLANLESMNAEFIRMELSQAERLKKLNEVAINQLKSLVFSSEIEKLSNKTSVESKNKQVKRIN